MSKIAVVFPGQGAQSLGMLSEMAAVEVIRHTFQEAQSLLGYDLWALIQEGPEDRLNQTEYTQPALLTASVALWRYGQTREKISPQFLAGHSLGEYSALVAAESLTFADAVQLVANRGRYMQNAVASGLGAMAAIVGLDDSKINQLCQEARRSGEVLSPANFNSIGQTVLAGHSEAIERALSLALSLGAKIAKRILVSVPSHCSLMQSAADSLAKDLAAITIQIPRISVIHNYDIKEHRDPQKIRQALTRQLTHPVRWVETIQTMEKNGIETVIECGPGKVLSGLNKRITQNITTYPYVDFLKKIGSDHG